MTEAKQYFPWGMMSWWQGSQPSGISTATRCEITVGLGLNQIVLNFQMKNQALLMDATRQALDSAFRSGKYNAASNIRKALGLAK